MLKKIKVGIIGLGNIGYKYDQNIKSNKYFYSHYKSFDFHKNFKIEFCFDINKKNLNQIKKQTSLKCFENINDLKKINNDLDIVVLAIPTSQILNTFILISKILNFKAILIEKPMVFKSKDALKIKRICNQKKIKLFTNYNLISDISFEKIKRQIQKKIYGKLLKGNIYYTKGIYTNASHYLNLLIELFGNYNKIYKINKIHKINEDFIGDFIVYFKNSKIYFQYLDEKKYSHYSMSLFFENGLLSYSNSTREIFWQNIEYNKFLNKYTYINSKKENIPNNFDKIQLNVVKNLYLFFQNKKYYIAKPETVLKTIKCIENIIK